MLLMLSISQDILHSNKVSWGKQFIRRELTDLGIYLGENLLGGKFSGENFLGGIFRTLWWQCKKKCTVDSTSKLQVPSGYNFENCN